MVAPDNFLGVNSLGADGVFGIWSGGAAVDFLDFFSLPEEDFFPVSGLAVPGFHMVGRVPVVV